MSTSVTIIWIACGIGATIYDIVEYYRSDTNFGVHEDHNGTLTGYFGYFFHGFFLMMLAPYSFAARVFTLLKFDRFYKECEHEWRATTVAGGLLHVHKCWKCGKSF